MAMIPVSYSDHRLVKAELQCARPPVPAVTYSYRDYRWMDMAAVRKSLQKSVSMLSPPVDLDDVVKQLDDDLSAALDRHAYTLRTRKRRQGKNNNWLSSEAVAAKQHRPRLERRFSRTKSVEDKRAYGRACRRAYKVITASRASHM